MGLKSYFEKRDFHKTPEPPPSKPTAEKDLRFVVQKHNASHLHYDFRIENEGVLKSWAVPKGFSMDPGQKRLAVQVEDHPLEYKDFEGRIPEGNYGAGEAIIWDEGTYSSEKSVSEALQKGHLFFTLNGKKLRGGFNLVRLKDTQNHWLLIKQEDEYAHRSAHFDEASVRSNKSIDDDFQGAVKAPLLKGVNPMLATLVKEPFDLDNWIFEVKWDGYRCMAESENGRVRLYSRNNIDMAEKFSAVASALKGIPVNALFDGEIVAVDENGRAGFQMLQNYMRAKEGRLIYYVFDILYAKEYDLRGLPLYRRKALLEKFLPKSKTIRLSDYIIRKGSAFFEAAKKNGLEGIIAKEFNSPYLSAVRSKYWLKIKTQKRQEAIICGFTEPRASRKFFGALILGIYKDKELTYIGHVGGGFDEETLKFVYDKLAPLITDVCPFKPKPPTNMPAKWVKPRLLCEVKFSGWTDSGNLRQPIFLGLREDKEAREAVPEQPETVSKPVGKRISTRVELSNLDKVFWPDEGLTKTDLINYYWQMAEYMLPFIKDRPQSLRRQPNGIKDAGFFQKNIEIAPEWIKTVKIQPENEDKKITYLVCQDKDSLLYMANLGCIEINVWNSRINHLEIPDYVVLDFDPLDVPFPRVVEAVLATKTVLDEIGIVSFCKTSGAKGMHVYIPLKGEFNYEQAKQFANIINLVVRNRYRDLGVSLERSPSRRRGLVYLDYLQNRYGATMAAPYSLRPQPGATVSTPLEWSEVKRGLNPLDFNIHTIPTRVSNKPGIWKDLFIQGTDIHKSLKALEELVRS